MPKLQLCRDKFCQSQFGQMLGGFTAGPLAGVTGGFLPSVCPPAPSPATLSALESQAGPMGAEAVAGKIKQSEADAKARVAAIEYLGTVDCNRWKEARIALINGLRADPNECVRYAAARVLNTGCCCSKPVIEVLRVCVSGEDTDGNPPETSQRVKAAAFSRTAELPDAGSGRLASRAAASRQGTRSRRTRARARTHGRSHGRATEQRPCEW